MLFFLSHINIYRDDDYKEIDKNAGVGNTGCFGKEYETSSWLIHHNKVGTPSEWVLKSFVGGEDRNNMYVINGTGKQQTDITRIKLINHLLLLRRGRNTRT